MKKGKILLFLVLVIVALFASNCVKQPPLAVPAAPAGLRVVQLAGGDVEFRWDAVAGAASYDVTIEKVAGSGSRETFGPYNTTNTYYVARKSVIGTGNFSWSVLAKNTAGDGPATTGTFDIPADPVPDPVYGLLLTLVEEPDQGSAVPTIYTIGSQSLVAQLSQGEPKARGDPGGSRLERTGRTIIGTEGRELSRRDGRTIVPSSYSTRAGN